MRLPSALREHKNKLASELDKLEMDAAAKLKLQQTLLLMLKNAFNRGYREGERRHDDSSY